ncbi:hypothetical protein B296_00034927 [Ensete ventricosum]|uniref:Uncharacterized protein n=1 Tax=Ensete ventricosum TaxID=4639 RepID=A0A426Z029_ENSVE|nr:hypothetical protein B296_00034927 [Ensete ventricosum]
MVNALAGYTNSQTMKIGGFLKQQPVTILIDTGSTNNFMNSKVVAQMMLQIKDCSWFNIKVADGRILKCDRKCSRVAGTRTARYRAVPPKIDRRRKREEEEEDEKEEKKEKRVEERIPIARARSLPVRRRRSRVVVARGSQALFLPRGEKD